MLAAVTVKIGSRLVGEGAPVFVIAEAGVNHNGDLRLARQLVEAAAEAGADAVKFQLFRAEALVGPETPKARYQVERDDKASHLAMLKALELRPEWLADLRDLARRCRIEFLCTPFDEESLDLLVRSGVPAVKVGSGELTNLPFLGKVGATGLPVILSTGMASMAEVREAFRVLERGPVRDAGLILLHCVSSYPAEPRDSNLRAMVTLADTFRVPVGFSDHTLGWEVTAAAVALGAAVIEKHITLCRSLPGPDHGASLEPTEFRTMVQAVRTVESALGDGIKKPMPGEADVARVARRSVVAARPLQRGTMLTEDMLAVKRPGTGIPPAELPRLLGRYLARDLQADEVITWDDVAAN